MASPPTTIMMISLFLYLLASAATATAASYGVGATFPIYKDETGTQSYFSTLQIGTPPKTVNFTLTLSSQLLWYICQRDSFNSSSTRPVACGSKTCLIANRGMTPCRDGTCTVMAYNPYDDVKTAEEFYTDILQVKSKSTSIQNFPFLCAGDAMYYLNGLPRGNKGMLGLALSTLSLPASVSAGLSLPDIFALCLPASGTGKLLVGGGPYDGKLDEMMETKMVINPYSTAPVHGSREESYEYFLNVTSIKVGAVPVKLNQTLLTIHDFGLGGTKLSLDTPFTTLQRAIYEPVVAQFFHSAAELGLERVESAANFSACFRVNDGQRPVVLSVDFMLESDGVFWRMEGDELMVRVSEGVSCLGVVDGGEKPRTAVVIGGRQMEERLVEFDLKAMRLRFSSSLRQHNSTCSGSF